MIIKDKIVTLMYWPNIGVLNLSLCMRKPTVWVPTRFNTNQPVQSQEIARSLKFRMKEEEGLYYPCSEIKDADQLCSYYCTADLRLFRPCKLLIFSCSGSFNIVPTECKINWDTFT